MEATGNIVGAGNIGNLHPMDPEMDDYYEELGNLLEACPPVPSEILGRAHACTYIVSVGQPLGNQGTTARLGATGKS